MYTRTAVAVKRLLASSQSPLFSQFADSLAGIAIIRARSGMSTTFGDQLAQKLRIYSVAAESSYNCNRWVALKIDMATTLVTVAAGSIAIAQAGTVAAGLVGFSLTNATVSISRSLQAIVRKLLIMSADVEQLDHYARKGDERVRGRTSKRMLHALFNPSCLLKILNSSSSTACENMPLSSQRRIRKNTARQDATPTTRA